MRPVKMSIAELTIAFYKNIVIVNLTRYGEFNF
jgi:hypothetical protein